jgi:hypothetical protein
MARDPSRSALLALAAALAGANAAPRPAMAAAPGEPVVVAGTLEAAVGQPLVHVQLRDGKRILTAAPTELERLLDDGAGEVRSFTAYLDTGSSAFVISRSTAARFGVEAVPGAVYHEVGLHGSVQMGVSRPYGVALGDYSGEPTEVPAEFLSVAREAALQLNLVAAPEGLALFGGGIDVVGMPAIRRLVVEIDPTAMSDRLQDAFRPGDDLLDRLESLAVQPAVRLHSSRTRPRSVDLQIELEYVDYSRRRHPDNRGPLPELAANPMITGVVTEHGSRTCTGDWFLDTGAAISIISTSHARALGLYDDAGNPVGPPDFTVVVGGIGGDVKPAPGYVLDRVRVGALRKRSLEFHGVHVVVRDVGIELPDGKRFVLHGVLGMNLLLPSASGLSSGDVTAVAPAPFRRVWIDGPRHMLSLDLP